MNRSTLYRAAVFLSAFQLFMVEPMISKQILPAFGGSFMVWGACMVFFQAVLLAGYVYAHLVSHVCGNAYARWHWVLLLSSLLVPVAGRGTILAAPHGLPPFAGVLMILTQTVGWPAFILSATSPLLQRWFSDTDLPGKDNPYALFAASNAGSLAGLLGYPLLMEPLFDLHCQFQLWWLAIGALAALQWICGRLVCRTAAPLQHSSQRASASAPRRTRLAWFLLGAAGCALFMATTNVITMDIAPAPLLWVLPLAAYLVAFILAFKNHPWRPAWLPQLFPWAAVVAILLCILAQMHGSLMPIPFVVAHLLLLLAACWVCATRLADLKPAQPEHLTEYYLLMGLGGLSGGAGVSWLAPFVSTELAEFPFSYALTGLALAIAIEPRPVLTADLHPWRSRVKIAGWCGCILIGLLLIPWLMSGQMGPGNAHPVELMLLAVPVALALRAAAHAPVRLTLLLTLAALLLQWTGRIADGASHAVRLRNFYGIYRVSDKDGQRILQHGSTLHGRQYLAGADAQTPAGYYHPSTPAGQLLLARGPQMQSIGMIGLGTGAMAWYGHAGTRFTVFELDPDGLTLAEREFSYLAMARKKGVQLSFVLGDGRISLRHEPASSFDLLLVDAFNSGSIPTHLLTVDAFAEYFRVIRPDGILLLHVSNRNLDLQPVVAANALKLGLRVASKVNADNLDPAAEPSEWMVISRSHEGPMDPLVNRLAWQEWKDAAVLPRPWTDNYSNILGAFANRK